MKRVLFAHRKLSFGGGERVLVEQVAAMADLPVQVDVVFRKEPGRRDIEPELRERNPRVRDVRHLPGALGCFAHLRRDPPDLLVLCNHKGVQRALPWVARMGTRIPTAVTLHEHYDRHLAKYRGVAPWVDRWLLTYDFQAQVARQLGTAPTSIIHPLYPRAERPAIDEAGRREARRTLGIPEQGFVVGYCGQIDGRKDPLALLRFAASLDRLLPGIRVLLAGREEAALARELDRAGSLGLGERLHRLGALPDLRPAFAALDLYVMSSRNEGFFPLALIEAMELGVPVLAPTVGGIGTVLKDGHGGFLMSKPDDRASVPPDLLEQAAARLAPLLSDPQAWEAQRREAHAFATELTRGYDAARRFREALGAWL
ncbi:MAG: glycosyltransferase family 4 protein [Acidobacteria bacterium]|nr:glycosyltransferase family 4 protein [Acidobacteriota bacterium]